MDDSKVRIRYIRKPNGDKKGVMVAIFEDDKVKIGFSLCNNRDTWDRIKGKKEKHFGFNVAVARADKFFDRELLTPVDPWSIDIGEQVVIPNSLREPLKIFISRLMAKHTEKEFSAWAKDLVDQPKSLAEIIQQNQRCVPRYDVEVDK